ncbi:MAG: RidA family protein [Phycisphaerae bacterium]
MTPTQRLASLGITLPEVPTPVGSYVPAIRTGSIILTSGQLPMKDGRLTCTGKVGPDVSLEQAAEAAAIAVINALAAAASIAGGLDRIKRIVRLAVFVNSASGFTEQAKVANGASDLLAGIFGEQGKHVRAAVGVAELPLNAAVELELTVELT